MFLFLHLTSDCQTNILDMARIPNEIRLEILKKELAEFAPILTPTDKMRIAVALGCAFRTIERYVVQGEVRKIAFAETLVTYLRQNYSLAV